MPILREQGHGRIIQISSVGGRIGSPGMTAYQSVKWAVGWFSQFGRAAWQHRIEIDAQWAHLGSLATDHDEAGGGWQRRQRSRTARMS
ncbi:SDR family NAD(P)-dependent oxidoreductase [Nocardia miyunensis]|uniref:SDR family NAD(P)-dependent oxidoreductase n=1 Tax=Nocardia miyunensis TaxID=282684 RepID=UPI00082FE89F|nr:SDR family NAD(P)-dependent oxidoreductase [Nocardia miyunensis]